VSNMDALDTFSGARGWDIAAEPLGWTTYGVENWEPARATAELNGFRHMTVADVTELHTVPGQFDLHLASPSCKKFSMAGDGSGRRALSDILHAIYLLGQQDPYWRSTLAEVDPDAALVVEPLRLALEGKPRAIAWEQAASVLPIWAACASVLRNHGYSVVVEVLNAEQYGVPQTRRRAVLMARRDKQVFLPEITHSRYWSRTPERLDYGVQKWVSIADALGWDAPDGYVVSNYGTGGDPRNRGTRELSAPAAAVTSKADRNKIVLRNGNQAKACVRQIDSPSGTMFFGARSNWMAFEDGEGWVRKILPEEAAALQTFPANYTFAGGKSKVMEQIGNAVPPRLAHAILKGLVP
jgi:DNA (cytosine-5)-methyltransferase 1